MKKVKKQKGIDHLEEKEVKPSKRKKWTDEDRKANEEYSKHHLRNNINNFFNAIEASL